MRPKLVRSFDPLTSVLLAMAIPLIGQLFFRTMLFVFDRALLGHYSTQALASMQISGAYFFCLLGLFGVFTNLRHALKWSLLFGAFAAFFSLTYLNEILALFSGATEPVLIEARSYLQIVLAFMPLYCFVMGLQATLDIKNAFKIGCYSAAVHIVLDLLLISPFGTTGCAIASVLATCLQGLLLFIAARKTPSVQAQAVVEASYVERLVQYGAFFIFVLLVTSLGTISMAAHQALVAIVAVCFLAADGFGRTAATQIAALMSCHDISKAERVAKIATSYSFISLSCVACLFLTLPEYLMRFFSSDPEVIAEGASCLRIASIAQPLSALAVVLSDALRGAGDAKLASAISLAGGCFVRLFAGYFFAIILQMGLPGIWWGVVCDWAVRALLLVPAIFRNKYVTDRLSMPL